MVEKCDDVKRFFCRQKMRRVDSSSFMCKEKMMNLESECGNPVEIKDVLLKLDCLAAGNCWDFDCLVSARCVSC